MGNTTRSPHKKNAVLKLFQRTITYPTKRESLKIIDCKSAGDWMGYVILPTLRIPKDPWKGLNLYGVRGPQATKWGVRPRRQHLQEKGMISKASLTEGISWCRIPWYHWKKHHELRVLSKHHEFGVLIVGNLLRNGKKHKWYWEVRGKGVWGGSCWK